MVVTTRRPVRPELDCLDQKHPILLRVLQQRLQLILVRLLQQRAVGLSDLTGYARSKEPTTVNLPVYSFLTGESAEEALGRAASSFHRLRPDDAHGLLAQA
jgi:hypothetical protein